MNWSDWLAVATLVHNNLANVTTGFPPSQLLVGWEPPLMPEQGSKSNNLIAEQHADNLWNNRALAIEALNRIAQKNTPIDAQWTPGQMVWLEAKNLSLPYRTVKLAPQWHRPFKIMKVISSVAYQLKLPYQWSIHPVFHTSSLTPYIETDAHSPNFSWLPPDLTKGEAEYKVEAIRNHWCFEKNKRLQYLLKWKGYSESDNTWEPIKQLHTPDLVKQYYKCHPIDKIKRVLLARLKSHLPSWLPPLSPTAPSLLTTQTPSPTLQTSPLTISHMSFNPPSFDSLRPPFMYPLYMKPTHHYDCWWTPTHILTHSTNLSLVPKNTTHTPTPLSTCYIYGLPLRLRTYLLADKWLIVRKHLRISLGTPLCILFRFLLTYWHFLTLLGRCTVHRTLLCEGSTSVSTLDSCTV